MNIQDSLIGNKRLPEYSYVNNKSRKEKNQEIYKQKLKQKKKQRKKENKKGNKNNESNEKEYLLNLLNNESKNNKKDSLKLEYQLLEENDKNRDKKNISLTEKEKNNKNNLDINDEMKQVLDLFQKKIEYQQKKIDKLKKEKKEQQLNTQKQQKEKKPKGEEYSSSDNDTVIIEEESRKKRKKRMKELGTYSLAELKSKAPYPEVVEPWDTNSADPELLIHFKCMPNTVPVPIHWAQNGKYLQSQRGKVRKPYSLPDYIEATGISRLRLIEIPVHITLQQKTRRRMRPKLGRTEIDYQILYDAFFKYQTKKRMTKLGEVYYEGKETDKRMRKYRPGKLTRRLRAALGISGSTIPPFVQNMQRYGPPPAYPFLKIPGVNIPDDDSSALATPGLWEEPDFRYTKEFIMIETENKNDDEEKDIEDMGNDQDALEISDEEKPDISGLFVKPDNNNNKELLNEEIKEEQKESISNKNKEEAKGEEVKDKQNNGDGEKFYKVIEQESTELKNNELNPVGFKYNIINTDNKKDENNNKDENKSNKEKEEDDEEEEEDIENINKNIFN